MAIVADTKIASADTDLAASYEMEQEIHLKNLKAFTPGTIETLVASLETEHLVGFLDDEDRRSAQLLALLEDNPTQQQFKVTLRLKLSERMFFCRDEGEDIEAAAENAFSRLSGRLHRYLIQDKRANDQPNPGSVSRGLPSRSNHK